MDPVTSLLNQIERLKAQNLNESDRDLRRENKKTIKELYKQVRKAAQVRQPWHGLILNSLGLCILFLVLFGGVLFATKLFGLRSTALASTVAAVLLTLAILTILLVTGYINQNTFKDLVKFCLNFMPRHLPNEPQSSAFKARKQLSAPPDPSVDKAIDGEPPE
jgi:hypothetical protein